MIIRFFSLACLGVGIFVLVQVLMPLVAFKIWEVTTYQDQSILVDPYPKSSENVLGVSVTNIGNFPAIVSSNVRATNLGYSEFKLSIPKINLDQLEVKVESNNFEQNLAHLPGSALPGEKGNVFITGHSSLIQLFRNGNYKAIFAHLPEIKRGDEVYLSVTGQNFKYIVEGIKIVDPKDVSVVNPPDNIGRYLTLMTCVPPGFNTKRLIVLARLKD